MTVAGGMDRLGRISTDAELATVHRHKVDRIIGIVLRVGATRPVPRAVCSAAFASTSSASRPEGSRGRARLRFDGVDFSRELRERVIAGEVEVSYRLWQRPRVSVGNRYPVGPVLIEIDSIELVPFSTVSPDDVRRSGEQSREALRTRAAHAGPIEDDTLVHRVEFHVVQPGAAE